MRGSIWSVIVLMTAACGSKATTGSVDARFDASAVVIDTRPGDGGPGAGEVACGTPQAPTTCPLPGNACCDFTPGAGTDYCFSVTGGICEGGQPIHCDGPEDCQNGEGCCYNASSGSSCTETPTCKPSGGVIMCHVGDNTPCAANETCCELHATGASSGGPFGTCHPGSCPV